MKADSYIFYRPKKEFLQEISLPEIIFPVRKENEKKIFSTKNLKIDLLFEELLCFLDAHPQYKNQYRDPVGKLAYHIGVQLGKQGKHDQAKEILGNGLALNTNNISLRTNYATALLSTGEKEAATVEFLKVIQDPNVGVSPHVWILTARLLADQKQYNTAQEILEECSTFFPESETDFWNFYNFIDKKSDIKRTEEENIDALFQENEIPEEYDLSKNEDPFNEEEGSALGEKKSFASEKILCSQCGTPLSAHEKFCKNCGTKKKSTPIAKKEILFCPRCGAKVIKGAKFCQKCGYSLYQKK